MKVFLYILTLFISDISYAQNNQQVLNLQYAVSATYLRDITEGKNLPPATVKLEGNLITNSTQSFYYEVPLYLQRYPNGELVIDQSVGHTFNLSTDTIQNIYYHHLDSTLLRMSFYQQGLNKQEFHRFNLNLERSKAKWRLMADTATINGFFCQRMQMDLAGGLYWDIWVHTDIQTPFGPKGIFYVPGLVVKAQLVPQDVLYELKTVKWLEVKDEKVFWPSVFNGQNFVQRN